METNNLQHTEQGGPSEWGFVAFIVIITAIAVVMVLVQIYLQNPQ